MPSLKFTCHYCDHKWESYIYQAQGMPRCPKCNDKDVSYEALTNEKSDVFGYNSQKPKKDAYIRGED